jgi:hypothetical protein
VTHHLAQLNIARHLHPLDSAEMKDFMDALPEINGLGDRSPGFVWRLFDESGDATGVGNPFGSDVIINLTVWESVESLRDFAYQTVHLDFMRRRREWFTHEGLKEYAVLWWIPAGHIPTVTEAAERLGHLGKYGASGFAFTFRERHEPPAAA